jgi:hypothetical protein
VNKSLLALATLAALAASTTANAADINLINLDPAGVGLNDTTPAAPVGGNPGTTRGEQARVVYRFAMDMWGGVLESSVDINVYASFAPLTCTSSSGTLASAGANELWLLNDGVKTRIYGAPLAESLVGEDLSDPSDPGDISSRFNGDLGKPGCLDGLSWYFGVDGNTPAGQVNFLNTVMHEVGHGLGVQGFLNKSTGALLAGYSDAYTQFAYDNVLGKGFEDMTNAERATAMKTPGRTVWVGSHVTQEAALALGKRLSLHPSAPVAIAGKDYEIGFAAFGTLASPTSFTNHAMVLIDDGNGTATDGCSALGASTGPNDTIAYVNAAAVAGKIAIIDRGTCSFEYKSKIAQDNGAIAVVIVNNAAGVIDMGVAASRTTVSIPTVMVSQADGAEIKANIASSAAGVVLSNLVAGADGAGHVRLYSPSTVAAGSTFSHFDTTLNPDALMEPFDSPTVEANFDADLTPALFNDIGWNLNPGNGKFANCDTGVDAVSAGGLVLGANSQAYNDVCLEGAANRSKYQACMTSYKNDMVSSHIITSTQGSKIATCIKRQVDQYGH